MEKVLERGFFVIKTCKINNDVCAIIPTGGLLEEEIDIEEYKTLITFLENSIKHREFLNERINDENNRILGKPKKIGNWVKKIEN